MTGVQLTPGRVVLLAAGVLLVVAGIAVWLFSGATTLTSATVAMALRPSGPITDAKTTWSVVPQGAPAAPGDVPATVNLVVAYTRYSKRSSFPPAKATVVATLRPQFPAVTSAEASEPHETAKLEIQRQRAFETAIDRYEANAAIADEVEQRTGVPVFAKAVRGMGRTVEIDAEGRWWGWLVGAAGIGMCIFSLRKPTGR